MNDFDALDALERELGPPLRVALRRAAADVTEDEPRTPPWSKHDGRATAAKGNAPITSYVEPPHRNGPARRRRQPVLIGAAVVAAAAAAIAVTRRDEPAPVDQAPPSPAPVPEVVVGDGHYTIDLTTGATTPLPESLVGGWSYPVSPDGTMVASNRPGQAGEALFVGNLDGTGIRDIPTPGVAHATGPAWSPDGSLLVYQGRFGEQGIGNLFVVDVSTDEVRQLTDLEREFFAWWFMSPTFVPDGESILFQLPTVDLGTQWNLWSVPAAGGEPTLVRRAASMGVYSPDGETLAYLDAPQASDGGGWSSSLWLADADGSDPRLLVDGEFDFARWSPDGTRIAYAGDGEIHVVDVATSETWHVATGGTAEWLDVDTLVVSPAAVTSTR